MHILWSKTLVKTKINFILNFILDFNADFSHSTSSNCHSSLFNSFTNIFNEKILYLFTWIRYRTYSSYFSLYINFSRYIYWYTFTINCCVSYWYTIIIIFYLFLYATEIHIVEFLDKFYCFCFYSIETRKTAEDKYSDLFFIWFVFLYFILFHMHKMLIIVLKRKKNERIYIVIEGLFFCFIVVQAMIQALSLGGIPVGIDISRASLTSRACLSSLYG